MHEAEIKKILEDVSEGHLKVDEAISRLKFLPFEDMGFAKLDLHRAFRRGFPEVIFCQNKTNEQSVKIMKRFIENDSDVLATRANEEIFNGIKEFADNAEYNEKARTISVIKNKKEKKGKIIILSAGTSDMPVAEEAAATAEAMGSNVERIYDVGVAGLHRLLSQKEKIQDANALVVVAGMDGVLPSVTSGIFGKPIIAVPTSIGYGAAFNGIAPLLTMLNSCSPGVVVVNIDNGFGAGYFANMVNK